MNQIQVVDNISGVDFYQNFVKTNQPVLIKNRLNEWSASQNWGTSYFKAIGNELKLAAKKGDVSEGKRETMLLSQYVELLEEHEVKVSKGEATSKPPYLHDVPLFHLLPELIKDIEPFPTDLFPDWYADKWYNYIQFFMGGTGSLTPLHFDTLYTHNLFFQVVGSKKFYLIAPEKKENCYVEGWRWAKFDPSNPDYDKFPEAKNATITEVIVNAGDILFMPSGTLHQVHGLSYSISFNIDWHTAKTAAKGVFSLFEGAPRQNVFYNSIVLLGLGLKIPSKYLFPYYKTYLNYVS
jgi:ribosomal protein L16 Arg81 hydroxylase